jgi:hypothetical protein
LIDIPSNLPPAVLKAGLDTPRYQHGDERLPVLLGLTRMPGVFLPPIGHIAYHDHSVGTPPAETRLVRDVPYT